jgi:hypothetical protein
LLQFRGIFWADLSLKEEGSSATDSVTDVTDVTPGRKTEKGKRKKEDGKRQTEDGKCYRINGFSN